MIAASKGIPNGIKTGVRACAAAVATVVASGAFAQAPATYPAKPVRILVGYAPGGGTDIMARALGAKVSESLKQQFIVDNRPGANANIAAKLAADAPADGYTLLFMSVSHIMSKPVYKNLGYDIETDLTPISVVTNVPNVLCVNPSLPARNVKDFLALARAKPGALTYATSGIGSPEHFAGEMFKMMTKTDLLAIPYKGGAPIAVDLVGGQVMSAFNTAPPIMPHIQSGRVRALAVTTDKRIAALPDVPTITESGVPGYVMSTWYGAVAPAKTPREIIIRLNQEMVKALALPDIKERMAGLGAEVVGNSPEEATVLFKSELAKYSKVAQAAKISADNP
ncbi:MAG: tripartite tricarboxylate transporter substrate binding protein [Burkholderiales bacterium]